MAWTTPRTWAASEVVSASVMNTHVRDQLREIGNSWASFTPTLTGWTLGDGTLTGYYKATGKHVRGRVEFYYGSTSATSGNLRVSLPVTRAAVTGAIMIVGRAAVVDSSTSSRWYRDAVAASTTEMQFADVTDTRVTGASPFAWATGDSLIVEFDYEAA